MTGRYCFHRCLSVNISGGGTPSQVWVGGTPSQVWLVGGTHLRSRGYPRNPPKPEMGYPPDMGWGTPGPGTGTPQTWDGVPPTPPRHGTGSPQTWGTPWDMGWGTPPDLRWGIPPKQISIASTCYTAGGMPLAFTQEDFLVFLIAFSDVRVTNKSICMNICKRNCYVVVTNLLEKHHTSITHCSEK